MSITMYIEFTLAVTSGRLNVVKYILDEHLDMFIDNDSLYNGVVIAYIKKYVHMLEYLLKLCIGMDYRPDGMSLIMSTSQHGYYSIVERLIELGANVNDKNDRGWTPLILASNSGHLNLIPLLVECGADINAVDNNGQCAAMYAVYRNNIDMVKLILKHGGDINMPNRCESNNLMIAIRYGNMDMVKYLTEETDMSLSTVDVYGYDILLIAAKYGQADILDYILKNMLHMDINIKNIYSHTPLILAAYSGYYNCVKTLLKYGADVNIVDDIGNNALAYTSDSGILNLLD